MAKNDKEKQNQAPEAKKPETAPEDVTQEAAPEKEREASQSPAPEAPEAADLQAGLAALQERLDKEHDMALRLAAEYDNFRKRTQKEKDSAYQNGKADAVAKFLPVYDNLERALQQETQDAAYKKGVEMTMTELRKILDGLGVTVFGEVGEAFDPTLHNAVMHTEDESLGENVICQVFQKGFRSGEKVIRFAMVQVAN